MKRRTFRNFMALAAGIALIPLFQNCSVVPKFGSQSKSQASGDGGNDQGYDGKVYVHNLTDNTSCSDGTTVDSKIVVSSANATLLRQNCETLAPADQQSVSVTVDQTDPSQLTFQGRSFKSVDKSACFGAAQGITQPLIDLQATSFSGTGDMWHNSGSGGWVYDFARGTPADPASYPTFVAANPPYWSFDGNDSLYQYFQDNSFINTMHKKGAAYTIIYEGYMSSGKSVAMVSNGGWLNRSGVSLTYGNGALSLQVGNGGTQNASMCGSDNSLCVQGSALIADPTAATPLFAAVSVNEAQGTGVLLGNSVTQTFNATYSQDSAVDMAHELDIGGIWEARPDNGSRLYRMRIWNTALTKADLQTLYSQSSGYCPY